MSKKNTLHQLKGGVTLQSAHGQEISPPPPEKIPVLHPVKVDTIINVTKFIIILKIFLDQSEQEVIWLLFSKPVDR